MFCQVDTAFAWEALEYAKGKPLATFTPAFRTFLKTQPGFAIAMQYHHIRRVHRSCRDHGGVCGCRLFCVDALADAITSTMERQRAAVVAIQSRWRGYDTRWRWPVLMLRC